MKQITLIVLALFLAASAAKAQDMSTDTLLYDHKGSTVQIEAGTEVRITYVFPRPGLPATVERGTLLFDGVAETTLLEGKFIVPTGKVSGTAYVFDAKCGAIPYRVSGEFTPNAEALVLRGGAPVVNRATCHVIRYDWHSREGTLPFVRDDRTVSE